MRVMSKRRSYSQLPLVHVPNGLEDGKEVGVIFSERYCPQLSD